MVPLSLNGKRYHFTKSKIKYWLLVFYVISVVVFGILLLKKGDLCYRVGKGIPPTLGVNKNPYIMKARYFLFSMMLLGARSYLKIILWAKKGSFAPVYRCEKRHVATAMLRFHASAGTKILIFYLQKQY